MTARLSRRGTVAAGRVLAGGTSELALSFSPPALPDLNDGVAYTLAVDFQASQSVPCVGVEWYVPATPSPATWIVSLWRVSDQAELAFKATSGFAGHGGQLVRVHFDTPVTLASSTAYRASVLTEAYVATTNATWPHTTGILTASAANGWLADDVVDYARHFPGTQSGNSANFHVSPVVQV